MIQKILKRVKSSELISVSFFSGISTVVKLATAFVTAKIIALYIGPVGLGVMGQLSSFVMIALPLSVGAITNGIVKYLAEYEGDENRQNEVIKASLIITTVCSVLVTSAIIVFSTHWSAFLFQGNADYYMVIIVFGALLICYALFTLFTAILNGLREYKKYNYLNILSSIVGLVFSLVLIRLYGLKGALYAMVTYQSMVFVVLFFFVSGVKKLNWGRIVSAKVNPLTYTNLFRFSLMAVVSAIVVPVAQIFIRNIVLDEVDKTAVGFYEAINRVSTMYLGVITTTLSVYYLPKLSATTNKKELKHELFKGYSLILPGTFVLLAVVYLLKEVVINLVFSPDFLPMESYFLPQLAGDFFKIASWLLAFQMWAKAMTYTFIISEILASLTLVLLTHWFVGMYGGVGTVYAYAINYILYFITMLFIFRKLIFYNK